MSRLHRGRKQLREKLASYAKELGYTTDAPVTDSSKSKKKGGAE
jgi:RNA polymerase sigma-70 factor (ECF subfamily)